MDLTHTEVSGHDHGQCVQDALLTAEHLCLERAVQLTPIRQQVLRLIWESHKAVKAYELLDKLKPVQNAAKPVTVYRALDFLIEQGLIHRVESLNAFVGCRCPELQHEQLLLICNQCNEVEERSAAQVMRALSSEIKQAHFIVHSKAIEIHGVCQKCAVLNVQHT
ncbi:transcriptional repressor [Crenothrix sp.]|uniref:transcriptional repressor n=1 Tax=Crenothrix sp. TaxID=3100433 RepID=UPI00374DA73F